MNAITPTVGAASFWSESGAAQVICKINVELFLELLRLSHMKAPKEILRDWYKKIGSKGGLRCTPAQLAARQANGAKGGRPKKVLTVGT